MMKEPKKEPERNEPGEGPSVQPHPAILPKEPPAPEAPKLSAMQLASARAHEKTAALLAGPQDKKSDAEIVLQMMNQILSKDNIEQKSRQTFENIVGISRAYVMMESMWEGSLFVQIPPSDGFSFIEPSQVRNIAEIKAMFEDPHGLMASLKTICDQMTVRLVSRDGLGRDELIRLAQAFSFTIQQHEHEKSLADSLIGNKGMGRR
jgi:hypothetical protein